MSNVVIFWTQIASILGFIVILFVLYRRLVDTKDATIELLKEKAASLERELEDARASGPDVLLERYGDRVKRLTRELEQLSKDDKRNAALIEQKEGELKQAHDELSVLQEQMERAQDLMSEFFCPHCAAPMVVREFHSGSVVYEGQEIDIDSEHVEYECGLSVVDGRETRPCRNHQLEENA